MTVRRLLRPLKEIHPKGKSHYHLPCVNDGIQYSKARVTPACSMGHIVKHQHCPVCWTSIFNTDVEWTTFNSDSPLLRGEEWRYRSLQAKETECWWEPCSKINCLSRYWHDYPDKFCKVFHPKNFSNKHSTTFKHIRFTLEKVHLDRYSFIGLTGSF